MPGEAVEIFKGLLPSSIRVKQSMTDSERSKSLLTLLGDSIVFAIPLYMKDL
jgi:hypothetical protein